METLSGVTFAIPRRLTRYSQARRVRTVRPTMMTTRMIWMWELKTRVNFEKESSRFVIRMYMLVMPCITTLPQFNGATVLLFIPKNRNHSFLVCLSFTKSRICVSKGYVYHYICAIFEISALQLSKITNFLGYQRFKALIIIHLK